MLAYLHASPRPPEGSQRAEQQKNRATESRLTSLKRAGVDPQMPPNPMPHLVERLLEIGLTEAAGMGVGPISWVTIDAWQRTVRLQLTPWEARLLRRLSSDYVAESRRAEDETCPPPWHGAVTPREREIEEANLMAVLG